MNEVVIYDESVSRQHAEISYHNNNFYLKDIGSTTGTYIKVDDKIDLDEGMIIEIGSYQFEIIDMCIANQLLQGDAYKCYITLQVCDGPEGFEKVQHVLEEGGTIGRKLNHKIHFAEDLHMSNLHCKISLQGNTFILEDMASTNGYYQF